MNAALRRGVVSGLFAGGFILLGVATATSASADTGDPGLAVLGSTTGSDGVGSGNQTDLDLEAPVRALGNQVTVLGKDNENDHTTTAGAPAAPAPRPAAAPDDTSGEDGVVSGNQTTVSACVPVTADGNQVTVVGDGNQGASGGSDGACESVTLGGTGDTSGEDGLGSGNQTSLEVCVPVTASGNQVTGVGDDNQSSSEGSGATCGAGEHASDGETSGEDGALSGNQTSLDVCVPVTATGNQLTVIGDDNQSTSSGSGSSCGEDAADGGTPGNTSGEDGLGSGNQTALDPNVPVDATGNQVTVIGEGNSNESTSPGAGAGAGAGTGDTTGEDGTGSGNQSVVDPNVPVDATGNQVTVIGEGNSNESTSPGAGAGAGAGTGDTTGEDGTGSGNQSVVDPTVPVDLGGNQVTVIGDDNTNDSTEEGPGEDPGEAPGEDPNDPGEDPGGGNGDGDGPGEGPGGQGGGGDSPGDTEVLPGQARAGALLAAPRAPSEVQAGLHSRAPVTTSPSSPVLPLLMLLLGALCVALAGRRCLVSRP